ncbi:GntR family transcriptional regulator [Streptomyces canus]|uniref:GntR family transcriptional regulator n=1 Tax=Streptomyces canus TaxID=58343 RepID=UPI003686E85D
MAPTTAVPELRPRASIGAAAEHARQEDAMARPKWRQLADDLAARIRDGVWTEGQALPQIRELTAQGVGSTTTVQAAYRALETEGLVRTVRGRGTFVRRRRPRIVREPQARYQWEKDRRLLSEDERRADGIAEHETGLRQPQLGFNVQFEVVEAPPEIARRFEVPTTTRVLHRHHWTSSRAEGAAISVIDSWILHDVAARNPALLDSSREPWPGGSMHQFHTIGIEIAEIVDQISARPPTTEEAELLDLDPGTAVIIVKKSTYSTLGELVEFSDIVLPGDRFDLLYRIPLK